MKKIFATALAVTVMLASCSKDGDVNKGNEAPKGVETKMGLSLRMPNPAETRYDDNDPVEALPAESAVKTVQVFIFNEDGTYDEAQGYAEFSDIAADFTVATKDADVIYTLKNAKAIEANTGGKHVYVGINLPAKFKGTTNVATEADLKKAVAFIIDAAAGGDNNLVGTNGVAMFSTKTAEPTLVAKEAGSDAIPTDNIVATDVERMVAKVIAQTSTTTAKFPVVYNKDDANELDVDFTVTGYTLIQQSESMYTLQNVVSNKLYTPAGVTPFGDYDAAFAAATPTPGWVFTGINKDGESITGASAKYIYTGENAPANGFVEEATYMLVQTTFKPAKKATVAGDAIELTTNTFAAGADIWVVRGPKTLNGAKLEQEVYFCVSEEDANDVALAINKANGVDEDDALTATYKQYFGGYAYFRIWLNLTDNVADKLAVYRNQFVHVLINGINGSTFTATRGTDESDGEDPEDPTDETDPEKPNPEDPIIDILTAMTVKITVKPWTYIGNTVILGE